MTKLNPAALKALTNVLRKTKRDVTMWSAKEAALAYMTGLSADEIRKIPAQMYQML